MARRGWAVGMLIAAASLLAAPASAQLRYGDPDVVYGESSRARDGEEGWIYARDHAVTRDERRRHFYGDRSDRPPEPRRAAYREQPERCSHGNVGTILGAIAGGLLGNAAIGRHGNHAAGTLGGAGAGALIGSAADRGCT